MRVGQALAGEDRLAPADAVVFLGDNFYPHGLLESELETRLRLNLVAPYCHFLVFSELGERALGGACLEPESLRHPLPLWAALGNHDHHSQESVDLQARRVPEYLPSWRLLGLPAETLELPQGVSLVFFDSTALRLPAGEKDLPLLTQALRESHGPWRILIGHHPLDGRGPSPRIEAAIAAAGTRAQLMLAGHIHDLRAGTLLAPLPALQVVSGGGGGSESNHKELPAEMWKAASTGFARVDLVGDGERAYLRVRMFEVSDDEERVAAAWRVSLAGDVSSETLALARR
jgi:hypothetical protein